ncbi:RhuM family protein [Rhizobium redzepovicii]|uniref:RhuM family protein n=1 Tax=Rhizobium redzepovicii TaxID=2867518 RepID=A0AAW8NYA6_9HYPH|nr:RhuM family protein [Rhizobium redzepovicii]MDR9759006.1 RhuM family protein [Rhizobium redzepovicii]
MVDDGEEISGKAIGGKARADSLTAQQRADIARKAAEARWSQPTPEKPHALTTVTYEREDCVTVDLEFDTGSQEIWATQEQISDLFGVDRSVISKHLTNIYSDGELSAAATSAKIAHVRSEGGRRVKRTVEHYNLDAVIAVGYRVSSKAATRFRQWSTQTLRAYIDQGYVINEKALRESPEKLNKLAAEIRALRSSEKQVYAKVRECFKVSSSDYDPSAQQVRRFYALLQDKFHHAVTGMTSSKLILDRADHRETRMGLQTMEGSKPTLDDATTGKNYLREDELYRLHLLSEQFLLYAESTALAGRKMTMKSLHEQLDRLLTLNDYPVFDGYKDFIKDEAVRHAKVELGLYKKRIKIEAMGIEYDEEALSYGEYDELLVEA